MGPQPVRKEPPGSNRPAATSGAPGARPLDPLVALLSRAAERSVPVRPDDPPTTASG